MAATRSISWKGLRGIRLKNDLRLSIAVFMTLVVLSFACMFTNNGFVSIPLGDTYVVVMLVLAPIAAASFLFRPLSAVLFGLLTGAIVYAHSKFFALSNYEMFFVSPWNSLVLIPLLALSLSLLFGLLFKATKLNAPARVLSIAVVCFATGAAYAILFLLVSTYRELGSLGTIENAPQLLLALSRSIGGPISWQMVLNGASMLALTLVANLLIFWWEKNQVRTMRKVMGSWMFFFALNGFLLSATVSYVFLTEQCEQSAIKLMNREYETVRELLVNEGLETSKFENYDISDDGCLVLGENGTIVAGPEKYRSSDKFEDFVYSATLEQGYDLNEGLLCHAYTSNTGSYAQASDGVLFAKEVHANDGTTYQIALIMPDSDVYSARTSVMLWVLLAALGLFASMFFLVMFIVGRVTIRGFDKTNAALAKICDGELDTRLNVETTSEFKLLSSGVNATVESLQGALRDVRAGYEREMGIASAIQQAALPATFPPFADLREFNVYASMKAAREVGGDFYDFFLIDNGEQMKTATGAQAARHVAFVVADVSGKGVPAALFMMAAKNELKNCLRSGAALADAVAAANENLCRDLDTTMFVTVFVGVLDRATGMVECANAGHNPPLARQKGRWSYVRECSGVFMGTFENASYTTFHLQLAPGDTLLLYTDGVTEAMNAADELWGEQALLNCLDDAGDAQDPKQLVAHVTHAVTEWEHGREQSDDVTLLALRFNGADEHPGEGEGNNADEKASENARGDACGTASERKATLELEATLSNLDAALGFVEDTLQQAGCPTHASMQLAVCAEELFVNVANYAYSDEIPSDQQTALLEISCTGTCEAGSVTFTISDAGRAFNPLDKPDPTLPSSIEEAHIGGLGILMTKKIADDIVYERQCGRNVLTLTKHW